MGRPYSMCGSYEIGVVSSGVMFAWDLLFSLFICIASNANQIFSSNKFNGFLFFSLKKTKFYLSFD